MKNNLDLSRFTGMNRMIVLLVLILSAATAYGWGNLGHQTICIIAEHHLTDRTKREIDKYLQGESIVKYASWLDRVRHTPEYKHTSGWHSSSVTEEGKHSLWGKKYRVYEGLGGEIEKMKNYKTMTDSAVAVGIKIIVHLVGDMHCPGHVIFKGTSQKYSFKVFGKEYEFHKFWDSRMLKITRQITPEYYAKLLDSFTPAQRDSISQGSLKEWIEDNASKVRCVYEWVAPGRNYNTMESHDIVMKGSALSDSQIRNAGYRLACILNGIFDNFFGKNI